MSPSPPLRVGLLGAGFLARTRARCWRHVHGVDLSLVAVAASSEERAAAFAAEHGVDHAFGDWRAVLDRDDVDLVDVVLPNHLHRDAVVAAAAAGKAVVCTKPLAAYVGQDLPADASDEQIAGRDAATKAAVAVGDARAMTDAASAAGVPLMYGENWVYAPAIRRAAGLLAASGGVLLEMRGEEAHSGSHAEASRRWRHAGGGALLRLGSHPVGAMLHLKRVEALWRGGQPIPVVRVSAQLADPLGAAPPDATALAAGARDTEVWGSVVLHFADGCVGTAFGSDLCLGGMDSRLELRASDSRHLCRLSPHDQLSSYGAADGTFGDAYLMEKRDGQAGWSTPLPDEDESSGHQGMIQAFAEAAVRGEGPVSDGTLGLAVTEVLSAAYLSAELGRPVALDELTSAG
jgi:predicted dehydrogenase